jgi:hypothetical protein
VKNVFGKLIGFVLLAGLLFGLFVVVLIPIEMIKKADAEGWPSRKGVVTKSFTTHHRESAGRSGTAPYYTADVCGTYKDNGEKFCVARIRYGGFRFGDGKTSALETVARYPPGSEVDVYHSPDDPKATVLEASSSWTEMFVLLGLGIGFLLIPVVLWLFRRKIEPERYGRA